MIAGFGGDLISHAYLEQRGIGEIDAEWVAGFERPFARWWQQVSRSLGPASGARAVLDVAAVPLLRLLGHDIPAMAAELFGFCGTCPTADGVVLVLPWSFAPSTAWRDAVNCGVASGATWAIITNGRSLRIMDCTRPWAKAGIEFDFDQLILSRSGIVTLAGLAQRGAMSRGAVRSLRAHVLASDAYSTRVCSSLSDGVLTALPPLAAALGRRGGTRMPRACAFDQSLTLIYRILFLLFAEARALVPIWHEIYRDAYTIDALTERAMQGGSKGLWPALQAIARLAHAGCHAGDLSVTAFNGRLFSPRHAPLAERRRLPDEVIREVLLSLATEVTQQGRRRISYHDLGVEQLGSVYERILEYEPAVKRGTIALERTSTRRKTTGSFYTPRALTEFLVRRTLGPLVDGRTAAQILELRVVDPAMGSGAFLVAACRFLADCCEQALVRDSEWLEADSTPATRASLRRDVAERCLYGVDLNPTAVQLARVSLWLTTLAADRPLTFLDHHLASGNSLVGARIADLARPSPLTRSRRGAISLPLFDDLIAGEVAAQVLPARVRLALEPSNSVEAVRSKERALAFLGSASGPLARLTAAADAWCAARLWPGAAPSSGLVNEWIAAAMGSATSLPAAQLRRSLTQAREIAAGHAAFHWELAFPEAFLDRNGHPAADAGFDAVIGNPPWEMMRADTGTSNQRAGARGPAAALSRFCRTSDYHAQGTGHPNSYQLFVERAMQLTKSGGRIGLILPSGIATDRGSAALRRFLFDRTAIDTWLGFDNRSRIFPIHRSMRFVVLSTTNAGRTETLRFRTGLSEPDAIERDAAAPLTVSRARLESWSAGHLTIPETGNPAALAILTTIAERVPALADRSGWNVRFGRELNATDDRPRFVALSPRAESILPIVEGKQLSPFQVDVARSQFGIPAAAARTVLDPAQTFERGRIAYRDVASATNKLTLIAAMLPRGTVSTHTLFCLKSPLAEREQWCLLGLMNSFIANYLVRLQVTTHVTTALMARLPVPRPAASSKDFEEMVTLTKSLAKTGITDNPDYAEVNAIAARCYGVSQEQYALILDTFPLIDRGLREQSMKAFILLARSPRA